MSKIGRWARRYSWLLIVAVFIGLVGLWVWLIGFANEHRAESIDISTPVTHGD